MTLYNLAFISKFLLTSLFFVSAFKTLFFSFPSFVSAIDAKNIPLPFYTAIFVLLLKFLASFFILFGSSSLRSFGVFLLVSFTLLTIFFFHNAFLDPSQFNHMFKNISIIGGLLALL